MRQKCVGPARMPWPGSLGRGEQHFSVHSFLLCYGCQLYVRLSFGLSVCYPLTAPIGILSQPWMIVPNTASRNHGSPPPDGADAKTMWSAQSQSPEQPKTIVIPKVHLHPSIPAQLSTSITSSDLILLTCTSYLILMIPNLTLQPEHTCFYHYGAFTCRIYDQCCRSRTQSHLYNT